MEIWKFRDLSENNPLFKTQALEGVEPVFEQAQNNYLLSQRIPQTTVDAYKVEMDREKVTRGGMTPLVSPGQETPIYNNPVGRAREKWEPAHFREKTVLKHEELQEFRQLGTYEDVVEVMDMLGQRYRSLQARLANRLEFMRKEMIFDNSVNISTEGGRTYTVNYPHPDYLQPSFSPTWDDSAATPMRDLQKMMNDYERHTSKEITEILLPHDIMNDLTDHDRVIKIANENYGTFDGSPQAVRRGIANYLDLGSLQVSKDRIHFTASLAADASQGATSLTFDRTPRLASGQEFIMENIASEERELFEVDSVSGNTVNLVGQVDRNGGFSAQDHIKYWEFTIPRDHLLVLGQSRAEMQRSDEGSLVADYEENPWAEFKSTLSTYANMEDPEPGLYTRTFDYIDIGDPPRIEQALGINGLVKLNDQEAFMVPTIR